MRNRSSIFTLKRSKRRVPKPIILNTVSGFDIQKQDIKLPKGDTDIMEEELEDILCIVCLDRISESIIEEHHKICSSKANMDVLSDLALEKNTEKIKKIRDFFKNNKQNCDPSRIKLYIQFCKTILINPQDYSKIKEIIQRVDKDLKKACDDPKFRIYLERVLSLCKEHTKILKKMSIEERSKKKEALKSGIKRLEKKRSKPCSNTNTLNIDLGKIEEIQSQVTNKYCLTHRYSDISNIDTHRSEKLAIREDDNTTKQGDFRQYFFSLCINSKMQLATNDPAQTVPINALFNKAQDQNIPPELWSQFVIDEFKNSRNWVQRSSKLRRSSQRVRRNGMIDCIPEEE